MGTRNALGVAQSKEGKFVLYHAEEELKQARILSSTSTCTILSVNGKLVGKGGHQKISQRFAILVEPRTGDLQTLVWSVTREDSPDQKSSTDESSPRLLEQNFRFTCPSDLLVERAFGIVPKGFSLAMLELPPGRRITAPGSLPFLTSVQDGQRLDAHQLERRLRALLPKISSTAESASGPPSKSPAEDAHPERAQQVGSPLSPPRLGLGTVATIIGVGVVSLLCAGFLFRYKLRQRVSFR
jgi:hypothetical protein